MTSKGNSEKPAQSGPEPNKKPKKQQGAMPQRAISRTAKMATLPVGFAGRSALGLGKKIGGKPAEAVNTQIRKQTAEQMFRVLGDLKGGAMKVGQALSVFEAAFPEEVAEPYRQALTKLQESAPPMPAETVHQVMAEELGDDWRDRFQDFKDEPAAAASIGQVHKAISRDGRVVAVKVQYPGAGKALMADMNQLTRMARLFGVMVPGVDMKPLLNELRDRVREELDYLNESKSQRQFAVAYEGDPDFVVPHVLAAAPKVLISEWVEGTSLSKIIADGKQEERNHAAQLYMRFLLSGPARAGLLHADPHPGNFRITPDGKFATLDYGATAKLPDGIPPVVGRILHIAIQEGDANAVVAGLREQNFILPQTVVDSQSLLNYLGPFIDPLRVDRFHFSRAWLREQFARINDPRSGEFSVGMKLNLPPSYLLIHRVWLGSTGVMCQLEADVNARQEVTDWVPGFAG